MGISYVPKHSLHTLNCIHIPDGADDAGARRRLLEEYGIEIGAGLGVMAGKAWRIGLMGHGATVRNVDLVLAALKEILCSRLRFSPAVRRRVPPVPGHAAQTARSPAH